MAKKVGSCQGWWILHVHPSCYLISCGIDASCFSPSQPTSELGTWATKSEISPWRIRAAARRRRPSYTTSTGSSATGAAFPTSGASSSRLWCESSILAAVFAPLVCRSKSHQFQSKVLTDTILPAAGRRTARSRSSAWPRRDSSRRALPASCSERYRIGSSVMLNS